MPEQVQPPTVVVSEAWMEMANEQAAYMDGLAAQWRELAQRHPQPLRPGEPLVWPPKGPDA